MSNTAKAYSVGATIINKDKFSNIKKKINVLRSTNITFEINSFF